jgi:hypothetical protein
MYVLHKDMPYRLLGRIFDALAVACAVVIASA